MADQDVAEKIELDEYSNFTDSTELMSDPARLQARMKSDGYLFLRGIGPKQKLLQLRRDILELCREAGWVDPNADLMEGKWSGAGPFTEGDQVYMDVYRKVIHLDSFKAAPEDAGLMQVMSRVIGGPVLLHNRKIGRVNFPKNIQQTTAAHQDFHYIRGSADTYTIWMPVGDCPIKLGGLAVLKSSHRQGYLAHGHFSVKKYAGAGLGEEAWPKGPEIEWHTGNFNLGDALIFHSHTIHKAMPNLTEDRLRLSIDNRYQREGDAIEPGSMGTHYDF